MLESIQSFPRTSFAFLPLYLPPAFRCYETRRDFPTECNKICPHTYRSVTVISKLFRELYRKVQLEFIDGEAAEKIPRLYVTCVETFHLFKRVASFRPFSLTFLLSALSSASLFFLPRSDFRLLTNVFLSK